MRHRKSTIYIVILFIALFSWSLHSAPKGPDISLGSGQRGLRFGWLSYDETEPPYTFVFSCDLYPGFPLGSGGFSKYDPVILKETLTQKYRNTLPKNYFNGFATANLYSFSKDKAFSYQDLFAIENGHIRIYPNRAQPEAHKVYGLSPDQIFLGAFEGRIYWWVKDKPRQVFFRDSTRHTFTFPLHDRVTKPLGMSKGNPDGDIALNTVVIPKGWYPAPHTLEWIVLNFKDAKPID